VLNVAGIESATVTIALKLLSPPAEGLNKRLDKCMTKHSFIDFVDSN